MHTAGGVREPRLARPAESACKRCESEQGPGGRPSPVSRRGGREGAFESREWLVRSSNSLQFRLMILFKIEISLADTAKHVGQHDYHSMRLLLRGSPAVTVALAISLARCIGKALEVRRHIEAALGGGFNLAAQRP